jgi:hypothetical protein
VDQELHKFKERPEVRINSAVVLNMQNNCRYKEIGSMEEQKGKTIPEYS